MAQKGLLSNICDLNKAYSDKLIKFSKPLMEYFGATQLHFDQLTYDGKLWCLNTQPDSLNAYVIDYDGFRNDPVCKDARLIHTNTVVWPFITPSQSAKSLNTALSQDFGIDQGVTFIFFDKKGCYGLAFSGSKENVHLVNILLKEVSLIQDFKNFLVSELNDVIPELERTSFDVGKYVGDPFFQATEFTSIHSIKDKIQVLLQTRQIEEKDLQLLDTPLSRRQKQCAFLFLQKHTIKEIAQILGLSMDTIRRYMFELKDRFHLNRKNDLLVVLKKLEKLDYFSGQIIWSDRE